MTHFSRGAWAAKKLLGNAPENMVVTDQYAGYHFIDDDNRQLCWAHILRNMTALAESWGTNKQCGLRLVRLIRLLFRVRHRFEVETLTEPLYLSRMSWLQQQWADALLNGERLCTTPRYRNRCTLLRKQHLMCWAFLKDSRIPLTNNEAERSLRSYVLWRKGGHTEVSSSGNIFSHLSKHVASRISTHCIGYAPFLTLLFQTRLSFARRLQICLSIGSW